MDFTFDTFKRILSVFLNNNYKFQTFENYIQNPINDNVVILRHDIDKIPKNAALFALIEYQLNIKGSFYFRIVSNSNQPEYINQIQEMGHEIGYHYENMDMSNGNPDTAIKDFEYNLNKFRKIYPVKTICMHGSPLSKYDNRDLWKKYDYRDYGIIGEPYFDLDFNEVFYLTDTGRRWDGEDVSVRDKIVKREAESVGRNLRSEERRAKSMVRSDKCEGLKFRSTTDIIRAVEEGLFPDKVMMTFHPQRWDDKWYPWIKELLWQNTKNVVKKYFYVK